LSVGGRAVGATGCAGWSEGGKQGAGELVNQGANRYHFPELALLTTSAAAGLSMTRGRGSPPGLLPVAIDVWEGGRKEGSREGHAGARVRLLFYFKAGGAPSSGTVGGLRHLRSAALPEERERSGGGREEHDKTGLSNENIR